MMILLSILLFIAVVLFLLQYNFWRLRVNSFYPRVLMYHSISDEVAPSGMVTSVKKFEKQIEYLRRKNYIFCWIEDLLDEDFRLKHKSQKLVALTFDDGFEDNYYNVFPIIKKLGIKITIYLSPEVKGDISVMENHQLKDMYSSGLVEFGAHTMSHINLLNSDDKIAKDEIIKSKNFVEKITGNRCRTFSYPYGRYAMKHVKMVEEAGFTNAVTVKKKIIKLTKKDAYIIPRLGMNGKMNIVQFCILLSRGRYRV